MNAIDQIFGSQAQAPAGVGKAPDELGQEDFLKLLVAQLKNQDPSNPVDNGEFLGQIAQFSMVSGIDDLGSSFDSIAGSLYANQAMQASQLVGKEVLVETDTAVLDDAETISGVLNLDFAAADIRVGIYDSTGVLVSRSPIGTVAAGQHKFSWDGQLANGDKAPAGTYVFKAEGLVNGSLHRLPIQLFKDVESVSVDRTTTSVMVNLEGNTTVNLSQVTEFK